MNRDFDLDKVLRAVPNDAARVLEACGGAAAATETLFIRKPLFVTVLPPGPKRAA